MNVTYLAAEATDAAVTARARPPKPRGILALQHAAGNAAVARLLSGAEGFAAIAYAVPEAGAEFYAREQYAYPTVGFTTKVHDHEGPDLDYGTAQRDGQWFAHPTVQAQSDEGTNESWALAAGQHAVPGEEVDGLPVVLDVSQAVATRIAAAEDEHNDDFRYARDRVLSPADAWLAEHLEDEYGPAESEEAAEALVDVHLNGALPAVLGLTAVEDFEWANLHAYYARLCDQTDRRHDEPGCWHTFDTVEHREDDRVRVELADGTTQIGTHPPAEVILPGTLT